MVHTRHLKNLELEAQGAGSALGDRHPLAVPSVLLRRQEPDAMNGGESSFEDLEALAIEFDIERGQSGHVTRRPGKARHKTRSNRVVRDDEHHRNPSERRSGLVDRCRRHHDDVDFAPDYLRGQCGEAFKVSCCMSLLDSNTSACHISQLCQALLKSGA
jgi:hypothetical protein